MNSVKSLHLGVIASCVLFVSVHVKVKTGNIFTLFVSKLKWTNAAIPKQLIRTELINVCRFWILLWNGWTYHYETLQLWRRYNVGTSAVIDILLFVFVKYFFAVVFKVKKRFLFLLRILFSAGISPNRSTIVIYHGDRWVSMAVVLLKSLTIHDTQRQAMYWVLWILLVHVTLPYNMWVGTY